VTELEDLWQQIRLHDEELMDVDLNEYLRTEDDVATEDPEENGGSMEIFE